MIEEKKKNNDSCEIIMCLRCKNDIAIKKKKKKKKTKTKQSIYHIL